MRIFLMCITLLTLSTMSAFSQDYKERQTKAFVELDQTLHLLNFKILKKDYEEKATPHEIIKFLYVCKQEYSNEFHRQYFKYIKACPKGATQAWSRKYSAAMSYFQGRLNHYKKKVVENDPHKGWSRHKYPVKTITDFKVLEKCQVTKKEKVRLYRHAKMPKVLILDFADRTEMTYAFARIWYAFEWTPKSKEIISFPELLMFLRKMKAIYDGNSGTQAYHKPCYKHRMSEISYFIETVYRSKTLKLNREEVMLRDILIEHKLLLPDGRPKDLSYCVLALCKGSQRDLILWHLVKHGVYLTDTKYRMVCVDEYMHNLTTREKEFYSLFFKGMGYNYSKDYLTKFEEKFLFLNEFQAFTLNFDPLEGFVDQAARGLVGREQETYKKLWAQYGKPGKEKVSGYSSRTIPSILSQIRSKLKRKLLNMGYSFVFKN